MLCARSGHVAVRFKISGHTYSGSDVLVSMAIILFSTSDSDEELIKATETMELL